MPRSGVNGTYSLPPNTNNQAPNTTISSSMFNAFASDVQQTFNDPTPVAYGGTGQSELVLSSSDFGVKDALDGTKRVSFNLSSVTPANTRMLTVPDKDGTIAVTDDVSALAAVVVRHDGQVLSDAQQMAVRKTIGLEFGYPMLHVVDEKPSGTNGGEAASSSVKRDLNTVRTNEIAGASLASSEVTLPAGTYYAEWGVPRCTGDGTRADLCKADGTLVIEGQNGFANSTTTSHTICIGAGRFTLAAETAVKLQHYTSGYGGAGSLGLGIALSSGVPEIYSVLKIWKLK